MRLKFFDHVGPAGQSAVRLGLFVFATLTGLALYAPASRAQGDLSIRIEVPEINPLGRPLTYTLIVSNAGPFTAARVVVTNQVPAALSSLQVLACQSNFCHPIYNVTNRFVWHEFAALPTGGVATVEVTGTPTNAGRVWLSAGAWPDQYEWEPYNNVASAALQLGIPTPTVFVQPATNVVRAGVPFQLCVGITNAGDAADGLEMISSGDSGFVPTGYTLSQGEVLELREGGIPWNVYVGTLPAGTSASMTLTLIPKRTGQLAFYVAGSRYGFGFGYTNAPIPVMDGPGIIEFATAETRLRESAGQATAEIRRHEGAEGTVQVAFATQDGTAIAGRDYVPVSGTLTFAPGETSKIVTIPLLNQAQGTGSWVCISMMRMVVPGSMG